MKRLWLVGMAPPDKVTGCFRAGGLSTQLVPLDPRHGVWPNHVMTPLFSTAMHLDDRDREEFFREAREVTHPTSSRRLNVFRRPLLKKSSRDLCGTLRREIVRTITPDKDLVLVFGFWSFFALARHVLEGYGSASKPQIFAFSNKYLQQMRPGSPVPTRWTARLGLAFKIWDENSRDGAWPEYRPDRPRRGMPISVLAAFVPLPHNEVYQNMPIGHHQSAFMAGNDVPRTDWRTHVEPQIYWDFIGNRIAHHIVTV